MDRVQEESKKVASGLRKASKTHASNQDAVVHSKKEEEVTWYLTIHKEQRLVRRGVIG